VSERKRRSLEKQVEKLAGDTHYHRVRIREVERESAVLRGGIVAAVKALAGEERAAAEAEVAERVRDRGPYALVRQHILLAGELPSPPVLDALNTIDPAQTAVVRAPEFGDYLNGFDPRPNGSIRLVEYAPHKLRYESNSGSEQLAVFSEIWYGPDKGWQAYLDGEPVEHIRVNYALRAMRVPAGEHEIEFVFAPRSFALGRTLSWISSSLLLLALGTFLVVSARKKLRETPPAGETPEPRKPAAESKARRAKPRPASKKRKGRKK